MSLPRLAIITISDSFSELWDQLGRFSGARVESAQRVADIHALQSSCAVIVGAAGMEGNVTAVLEELKRMKAPEIIVVGTEVDYRIAIEIIQSGASDYFALPSHLPLCKSWLCARVEAYTARESRERFATDERNRFDFSRLIGQSALLKGALRRTSQIIPCGAATILITGETGTGKELLARAIHYNGSRAANAFVEINCTTLPENLLEAELFGYEPGAFTDARASKPGLFEVADGGTLFLDEIGDLTPPLQAKLLRVLEEKRVRRLGSVRDVELDLRVVAATHVDLPEAIRAGRFRQDLYYRLNVVPIRLPALRERGDDVLELAEHFLDRFTKQYHVGRVSLSPEIKRALRAHNWPGNVRELRNAIERAVLLGGGNLFVEDLFPEENVLVDSNKLPFPATMQTIERAAALAMVKWCGGNKSEAAKALGISRKHLYTLISAGGKK